MSSRKGSRCHHAVIIASEVSLLGEGVKSRSDWFRGKNRSTKKVNFTVYGRVFCVSPLEIDTVDTENMAAIEQGTKREEMRLFPKFMADLQLQQSNTP